jgi:hypothetical protein
LVQRRCSAIGARQRYEGFFGQIPCDRRNARRVSAGISSTPHALCTEVFSGRSFRSSVTTESLDDDNVAERREPARADRNRLSGRQLNALNSLARQHGLDHVAFRETVKRDHGVMPEACLPFFGRDLFHDLMDAHQRSPGRRKP